MKKNYFSFNLKITFSLLIFLSISNTSFSQQSLPFHAVKQKTDIQADPRVKEVLFSEERITPQVIHFNTDNGDLYKKEDAPQLLETYLSLDKSKDAFNLKKSTETADGIVFDRYQQFYKDIKVEHGQYNALSNINGITALLGEFYNLPDELNTTPTLSQEDALQFALDYVGAEQYAYDYVAEMINGVDAPEIAASIYEYYEEYSPGGELTIVDNYDTDAFDLDLAYKFNIYANEPVSRAYVYVNAHTGVIMLNDKIIKHASTPVQMPTRYAGMQDIYVKNIAGNDPNPLNPLPSPIISSTGDLTYTPGAATWVLIDDTRGGGLETYDLNGVGGAPVSIPAAYNQAKSFTDTDNNWTLAEHKRGGANEAENDDIAWDAHWGTQVVYDYWLAVHGRQSYDDNNIAIRSFIHSGVGYDNAFWNGTAMTYGDGSYEATSGTGSFAPLTSLDVCGHEVGHAICSFTADLVYAKESGAMNEGFSDIWGACIEDFAFRTIDSDLSDIMTPWGIGEQIDERDGGIQYPDADWQALRYMNDPNLAGDPDTYGGANWTNPDCDPSLANDQCGVHSNSGVLNKWFYILTAGETAANDNGDNYDVTGIGFVTSEKVAYGTELLLTPNATFAEARAASIAFVRSADAAGLTGAGTCGDLETAVTNSWYGVGVGPEFNCTVSAGFTRAQTYVGELDTTNDACDAGKTITIEAAVVAAGTAIVSGTATENVDFILMNPSYTPGVSGFGTHDFEIKIFDDADIEGVETIILTIGTATHTIFINDNDVVPAIGDGSPQDLINEAMTAATFPTDWSVKTFDGGPNSWFSSPLIGAHIGIVAMGGGIANYEGNTDPVDVLLSTNLVDARGLGAMNLSFDWSVGGEQDAYVGTGTDANGDGVPDAGAALFDYGNLAYSYDGEYWIDFTDTEFSPFAANSVAIATGTLDAPMPSYLTGNLFYLGFRWRNDPLLNGMHSFTVTNVNLTAETVGVQEEVASSEDKMGDNADIYYFAPGGAIISKIKNNGTHDYGCTTVEVVNAGTASVSYPNNDTRMSKTFSVTPTTNNATGTYDITLYYTEAELAGYEAESGESRTDMVMMKTEGSIEDATPTNTIFNETVTYTPHTGGGSFTATFVNGFSSFVMGHASAAALPVELVSFDAEAQTKSILLEWETATETNNAGFELERRAENETDFRKITFVTGSGTTSDKSLYNYIDKEVIAGTTYFYRLRQLDFDGKEDYSNVVKARTEGNNDSISISPNPTGGIVSIAFMEDNNREKQLEVYELNGRLLLQRSFTAGENMLIDMSDYSEQVYLFRITANGQSTVKRVIVQK